MLVLVPCKHEALIGKKCHLLVSKDSVDGEHYDDKQRTKE